MARGKLGKSRPLRQTDAISTPVLKYSDAVPRNDLKAINHGVSYSRPIHQSPWLDPRPTTSQDRRMKKTEKTEGVPPPPGLDFRMAGPPAAAVQSPTGTGSRGDAAMIGIALGGPGLGEPESMTAQTQQSPPPPVPEGEDPQALLRKSSKWRKIGGLFKAKSAMAANVNKPFYQVRTGNDWPLQDSSSHSVDLKSRPAVETQRSPVQNTEAWPCLVPESEPHAPPGPLLQVEIPNVEMERYSVMFGGLLQKGQPSSWNRRSRTLDGVAVKKNEELPLFEPPRRRATSPTRSRSPNFTLFPTTPTTKASKVLGSHNLPQGTDILRKTPTHPLESRPESPASEDEDDHVTLPVSVQEQQPPPPPSHHQPQESATSGPGAEPQLAHKVDITPNHVDAQEPQWEMMVHRKNQQVEEPKPKLRLDTQNLRPSATNSRSTSPSSSPASSLLSPLSAVKRRDGQALSSSSSSSSSSPIGPKPTGLTPRSAHLPRNHDAIPAIEVSVARSVSVSRGKKQVIVPVRPRADRLNTNERLVVKRVNTPKVTDGQYGHRHGNSQDARIEMA
ncbi:hypothetical protein ARAM_003853 [Aspergillus rambellii]|uniref:Uncharacterized protein n=1 Tax=Aspergillus rambellii TaxID=308745 RepID=A0A0F8XQ54_9EURO|nr:hypothetical protein ARAM_003853 [Aspergillus rambellii]